MWGLGFILLFVGVYFGRKRDNTKKITEDQPGLISIICFILAIINISYH